MEKMVFELAARLRFCRLNIALRANQKTESLSNPDNVFSHTQRKNYSRLTRHRRDVDANKQSGPNL